MSSGSFRIGTIRGIDVRVHFTFLLVLPLLAFSFARTFAGAAMMAHVPAEQLHGSPWVWGLALAIALFASVLVHELAHSLYALRTGGKIQGITLLMIGGVSEITELPAKPKDEAIMALLGPAVSLAIGAACYLLQMAIPARAFSLRFGIYYLGSLNLVLGIFNLIPAYPMDGGRILRSILTPRMGRVRATELAARVGKVLAVPLGVWGFATSNMLLVLVAFFVFIGADSETRAEVIRALLGNLHVREVMSAPPPTVPAEATLDQAADRMWRANRMSLAVIDGGRPVGVLTLERLRAVPGERRSSTPVRTVAVATPPLAPADEATLALRLLGRLRLPELPVTEGDRLVGSVSRDDIARVVSLNELRAGPARRRIVREQEQIPT